MFDVVDGCGEDPLVDGRDRPSISSGFRPVNCQATATTGILMLGKMSVGVREITTGLASRINSARTINVYGRLSASLTIHIINDHY